MTGQRERWILIFESIHQVLAAERVLEERAIWFDLIPTPKQLSGDCGMCIEVRAEDSQSLADALRDPKLRSRGAFKRGPDGYEAVPDY